jgi:hypothetical protein
MAETNFTSYDEVLKSGLIGDILYLVISEKEQLKTYKDLSAFLGGAVGILPFVVGGLSSLYENMDTQTYFGKTQKEMIDGYSTSCLPPGKEGNDTGWGCYSQKFWYDGMKLFLNSPDSKSVQDKAWVSKTKPEIENVLTKGWKTKRQITIALTLSIKLGQDAFKSFAESNTWDAEKTLQAFVNKTSDQKTKKSIDDNFPFQENVETVNQPNNTNAPVEKENEKNSQNSTAESSPNTTKEPDFPEDKIYTFNVTDPNFLVSSEIGTFSVVNFNPEFDFEGDVDNIPLDEEYYEEAFVGDEEVKNDLTIEDVKIEKETLTGETFELPANDAKSGSSGPAIDINSGVSSKDWANKGTIVSGSKVPSNVAKAPSYNSKVSLNKTITSKYLPVIKGMTGYTTGIKLLAIVQAQKEGYYPDTRSYRYNNPGNIGNTDSGNNKGFSSLKDGIQAQINYIYAVAKGSDKNYPLNVERTLKPYYSKEIDDNNGTGQVYAGSTAYLPGYKFVYTGKIEQYVKIYSTGARQSNSYITTIVSWFRQNGFTNVTEETTIDELIKLNKKVDLLS